MDLGGALRCLRLNRAVRRYNWPSAKMVKLGLIGNDRIPMVYLEESGWIAWVPTSKDLLAFDYILAV